MTITLFQDRNFRDRSMVVTRSVADLQDVSIGANPTSIRLTGSGEAILLYTQKAWDGDVHYIRGPASVEDLGSNSAGGESGFRNNVRAVRITPFRLRLNVNVVRNESGELPAQWPVGTQQERLDAIVGIANDLLAAQRSLLTLQIARITLRTSNAKYNLSLIDQLGFPGAWRNRHEVDVMVVNQFERDGQAGVAKLPHFGQAVVVAASVASPATGGQIALSDAVLGRILAHELGHYLGLVHHSAGGDEANLMDPSPSAADLSTAQVETIQQTLANALGRGGDRHE